MDTLEGRQELGTGTGFAMAGERRRSPADLPVAVALLIQNCHALIGRAFGHGQKNPLDILILGRCHG